MDQLILQSEKHAARQTGFAQRKRARSPAREAEANQALVAYLAGLPDGIVSAYMPIQTEIDPGAALAAASEAGRTLTMPVIQGQARPLVFRSWQPGDAMIEGDFGAMIPRGGAVLEPDILIVPLLGFTETGHRLGYGGGYFDRTLAQLRAQKPVIAVGFAFEGQKFDRLPLEATDEPLDALITESKLRQFARQEV